MKRHTFSMEVKEGKMGEFRKGLGEIWPELVEFLDTKNIQNFSIWNVKHIIFGYFETSDSFTFTKYDRVIVTVWEEKYGDLYSWISTPFDPMRMMYHDFGIVRESKELIRHRVFITKLKPGMEEEYKCRHDALVEARGNEVTQGPDSNFSIWHAGGYIFGYNEIDTTMEHEMTQEEIESTIRWEKSMLEIMEWLTNDVDWITGECHDSIRRICWHT